MYPGNKARPDSIGFGRKKHFRTLSKSDILACPFTIMMPEHYRGDGSCRCDDPEHQKYMIREWGYTEDDFSEEA